MKTAQLGIELGTRHLRICTRDKEEFLKIKNMIAFDEDAKLKAFGNEAFAMYEKQPYSIHVVKPMEHGVISDYTNMRYLLGTVLDHYFKRIRKTGLMIAVPVDITNVEKRAFEDLAWESASRVKDVTLVPKPILAAIGSGIDVNAPCGNMIIDIGASTTEISVISLGGIVTSRLLPYGGDQIDEWIRDYVKKNYKLAIGTRSARHLKLAYAKIEDKEAAMIKGRDLVSGLPKQEKIPIQIVEEQAQSQVRDICVQVKAVLESITPELASDIMNQGIYVSVDAKAPDRVIAFSTDGAACVAPIDYLNEKYEGFGVLWLDVHREPVTPERFWRKRAALFSTFTGDAAQIPGLMKTSIPPSRFFFVSTRADEVPPAEDIQFHHLEIGLAKEEALDAGNTAVLDWLKASGIKHLAIHIDLDSVGSADIRSGIYREEGLVDLSDPDLSSLKKVGTLLKGVSAAVDVVGVGVLEYQMLDAPEFRGMISDLPIFKG